MTFLGKLPRILPNAPLSCMSRSSAAPIAAPTWWHWQQALGYLLLGSPTSQASSAKAPLPPPVAGGQKKGGLRICTARLFYVQESNPFRLNHHPAQPQWGHG